MISLRSKITQKVLSYFLLNPEKELYLNEMARRFDVDRSNLTRKLAEWVRLGILIKAQRGNLSLYKINRYYPLFIELRSIIQKSIGIESRLKQILLDIKGVKSAFIFGSYAKNKMDTDSDIDLLVTGSYNLLDLQRKLVELQKDLGREINVIDMTEEEFLKKRRERNGLLKRIFNEEYIQII